MHCKVQSLENQRKDMDYLFKMSEHVLLIILRILVVSDLTASHKMIVNMHFELLI